MIQGSNFDVSTDTGEGGLVYRCLVKDMYKEDGCPDIYSRKDKKEWRPDG